MRKLLTVDSIALILVIVGGINWGLIGLLGVNLVELIFSSIPFVVRIIYILVGVAAIYLLAISGKLTRKLLA